MLLTRVEKPEQLFFLTAVERDDIQASPDALRWSNYHSVMTNSVRYKDYSIVSKVEYTYHMNINSRQFQMQNFGNDEVQVSDTNFVNNVVQATINISDVSEIVQKFVLNMDLLINERNCKGCESLKLCLTPNRQDFDLGIITPVILLIINNNLSNLL